MIDILVHRKHSGFNRGDVYSVEEIDEHVAGHIAAGNAEILGDLPTTPEPAPAPEDDVLFVSGNDLEGLYEDDPTEDPEG